MITVLTKSKYLLTQVKKLMFNKSLKQQSAISNQQSAISNLFFLFVLGTSEDDVDVDIKYCGYCHTDIHLINNDWGFTTYPAVGGHEVSTLFDIFKDIN